jgi:hypothetical protein
MEKTKTNSKLRDNNQRGKKQKQLILFLFVLLFGLFSVVYLGSKKTDIPDVYIQEGVSSKGGEVVSEKASLVLSDKRLQPVTENDLPMPIENFANREEVNKYLDSANTRIEIIREKVVEIVETETGEIDVNRIIEEAQREIDQSKAEVKGVSIDANYYDAPGEVLAARASECAQYGVGQEIITEVGGKLITGFDFEAHDANADMDVDIYVKFTGENSFTKLANLYDINTDKTHPECKPGTSEELGCYVKHHFDIGTCRRVDTIKMVTSSSKNPADHGHYCPLVFNDCSPFSCNQINISNSNPTVGQNISISFGTSNVSSRIVRYKKTGTSTWINGCVANTDNGCSFSINEPGEYDVNTSVIPNNCAKDPRVCANSGGSGVIFTTANACTDSGVSVTNETCVNNCRKTIRVGLGPITVKGNVSCRYANGRTEKLSGLRVRFTGDYVPSMHTYETNPTDVNGNYSLRIDNTDGLAGVSTHTPSTSYKGKLISVTCDGGTTPCGNVDLRNGHNGDVVMDYLYECVSTSSPTPTPTVTPTPTPFLSMNCADLSINGVFGRSKTVSLVCKSGTSNSVFANYEITDPSGRKSNINNITVRQSDGSFVTNYSIPANAAIGRYVIKCQVCSGNSCSRLAN